LPVRNERTVRDGRWEARTEEGREEEGIPGTEAREEEEAPAALEEETEEEPVPRRGTDEGRRSKN